MEQLYRKVKCSKRLPKRGGYYDTDYGKAKFSSKHKDWNNGYRICPDWWLEPIDGEASQRDWDDIEPDFIEWMRREFYTDTFAAKHILKWIKNKLT